MQLELFFQCKCKKCVNEIPYFRYLTFGYCPRHYLMKLKLLNPIKYKKYKKIRNKILERRQKAKNPMLKIKSNLGKRIRDLMFKYPKSKSKMIGCSGQELKKYLESKFLLGMSWENYGKFGWHVDHIKPLSKFNLSNAEEIEKANHYTNLQPLWWRDNLQKLNKYVNPI